MNCARSRKPEALISYRSKIEKLKDFLEGKPQRHPIHPMLVHFSTGLLLLNFFFDLASLAFSSSLNLLPDCLYAMLLGLVLSLIGVGLLSASGYLGGRLVYDQGIAVGRHKRHMPTPRDTIHLTTPIPGAEGVFVPIMAAQRLCERETLRVAISAQIITIVKIDNQLFAFQEFCTHRFGPLSEGSFDGFNVRCPWHNSCFDVRTGKVTHGPAKVDLKIFEVEMREGKVGILLPRQTKSA